MWLIRSVHGVNQDGCAMSNCLGVQVDVADGAHRPGWMVTVACGCSHDGGALALDTGHCIHLVWLSGCTADFTLWMHFLTVVFLTDPAPAAFLPPCLAERSAGRWTQAKDSLCWSGCPGVAH